jgi:hypothetical protein
MAKLKYGKYVIREPKVKMSPQKEMRKLHAKLDEKSSSIAGKFDCSFTFVGILAPHLLPDPPHKHDCDEILFFMPSDPANSPDLGGEVEIALGDEWEKHVINTSAIICLPKGIQHCPVFVKKVNKPFYFGHILLASIYGSSETPPGSAS